MDYRLDINAKTTKVVEEETLHNPGDERNFLDKTPKAWTVINNF